MARLKLTSIPEEEIVLYCSSDNIQKLSHLQKIFLNNFEDFVQSGIVEIKIDILEKSIQLVFYGKKINIKTVKIFQAVLKYDVFIRIYGINGEVILFEDYETRNDFVTNWIGIDESRD